MNEKQSFIEVCADGLMDAHCVLGGPKRGRGHGKVEKCLKGFVEA